MARFLTSSVDAIIGQFQAQNISAGMLKGMHGSWKTKAKQYLTAYAMTLEVYANGVPDDARIAAVQKWLDGEYKFIDTIDQTEEYWKQKAVALLGARLKTFAEYRRRLWDAALRLFHGGSDPNFIATFARSIDVEMTKAWNEGAKALGIAPDEMTDRDINVLRKIIASENSFILGIAADIQAAAAEGMDPDQFERQFSARVKTWANRYNDVVNQALLYWGKKERLTWVLGDREKHCSTCPRLAGIVAFGDEWTRSGFHPQRPPNDKLECGGWNCGCELKPTKARRTTNALKKLRAISSGG